MGAILYELLTGRLPFQAATTPDTILQVIEDEPVPPRQLNSKVPVDLEKDPRRRYQSAEVVAQDLARFQVV